MPLLSLVMIAVMVVTLIDVITRDDSQIKHLPKIAWLIIVILLPLVGSIVYWIVGREYPERSAPVARDVRRAAPSAPVAPSAPMADRRTTEQQLADLEREIEEERLRAELARLRRERGEG